MNDEVKEYLRIRQVITSNKIKLVSNTKEIKDILLKVKKIDDKTLKKLMNIYDIERGNVLISEENRKLELQLVELKLKYFDMYGSAISLVPEVKNYKDTWYYKDNYLDYFKLCDKVIYMLSNRKDDNTYKIINSLNSSISRRIMDESEKSGKDIYFYIEERKKYQELNNMV